jgi:hypothetical protein
MTAPVFGHPMPNAKKTNPMLVFGAGPEGKTCKTCKALRALQMGNRYYKCVHRKLTHGPGSDHRVNWPACARYQEAAP